MRGLVGSLLLLAACGLDHDYPVEPGWSDAVPLAVAASYRLDTRIDIQLSARTPPPIATAVDVARELSRRSGSTLFALAARGGVPALEVLRAELPAPMLVRAEAAIDEHVAAVRRDQPDVAAALDTALVVTGKVLGRGYLAGELTTDGDLGQHRVDAVGFYVGGELHWFAVDPALLSAPFAVDVYARSSGTSELILGEHDLQVPFGAFGRALADEESVRQTGAPLRTALDRAIDCPRLAFHAATACVGDACVGHPAELQAVCEGALAQLIAELRGPDRTTVVLESVGSYFYDWDRDGVGDEIDGIWTAHIDAGAGLRDAPATFYGAR